MLTFPCCTFLRACFVKGSKNDALVKSFVSDGVVKSSRSRRRGSRVLRRSYLTPQGQRDGAQRRYWTFYGAVKNDNATFLGHPNPVSYGSEVPNQIIKIKFADGKENPCSPIKRRPAKIDAAGCKLI
jgi:hypothetical protein